MKNKILLFFLAIHANTFAQTTFSCSAASTICSCPTGVREDYYSGYFNDVQTYFTTNTPGLTRVQPQIGYSTNNWGTIVPPSGGTNANPEAYSTRFSGRIFLAAGQYTFYLTSDDACFFWLGTNALAVNPTTASSFINNGGLHSPTTVSAVGIFTSTCLQDFKIHYGENTGDNRAVLEYASTALGIARQVVPTGSLCSCMSSGPLPIDLLSFTAKFRDQDVHLRWKTATEKNNKYFTILKSGDGSNWSPLESVPGSGTTSTEREYSLIDKDPIKGISYYYLSQTDEDGREEKLQIVSLDYTNIDNYVMVYPNPFLEKFTIQSSTRLQHLADINFYDAMGSYINIPFSRIDDYSFEINTSDLDPGNYTLKIKTPGGFIVKRLFKN